jgi:hypothetical protein
MKTYPRAEIWQNTDSTWGAWLVSESLHTSRIGDYHWFTDALRDANLIVRRARCQSPTQVVTR